MQTFSLTSAGEGCGCGCWKRKIKRLLTPRGEQQSSHHQAGRIHFHRFNIKHDFWLEGLIKMSDLFHTINLAAICTPADYNSRPLETINSNFIDAIPVKYCSKNGKRLIHFSTCEVYVNTIRSFLSKDHRLERYRCFCIPLSCTFLEIVLCMCKTANRKINLRWASAEGVQNGLEFTILRPFNWIAPRMDFIPGIHAESSPLRFTVILLPGKSCSSQWRDLQCGKSRQRNHGEATCRNDDRDLFKGFRRASAGCPFN